MSRPYRGSRGLDSSTLRIARVWRVIFGSPMSITLSWGTSVREPPLLLVLPPLLLGRLEGGQAQFAESSWAGQRHANGAQLKAGVPLGRAGQAASRSTACRICRNVSSQFSHSGAPGTG